MRHPAALQSMEDRSILQSCRMLRWTGASGAEVVGRGLVRTADDPTEKS